MKTALAIVVGLLLTAGRAEARDAWTWQDTAWEAGFVLALSADWNQTVWAMRQPGEFTEANPILGRRPSNARLAVYNLTAMAAHAGVSYLLPSKWRRAWQCVSVGVEVAQVVDNWSIGARFTF